MKPRNPSPAHWLAGIALLGAGAASCGNGLPATETDLQHHRWVLDGGAGQSLDFGERMFFEAKDGCHALSGFATLTREGIVFEHGSLLPGECAPPGDFIVSELPGEPWEISLPQKEDLLLRRGGRQLRFKLDDWR